MNASTDAPLHLDHWRINRGRLGLAIFVFLLILGAAAVFTYFGPNTYVASATVEVQTDQTGPPVAQTSATGSTTDPNFAESQLPNVFSHDVLDPVIRQLDLQTKWSQNNLKLSLDAVYEKLRRMILLEVSGPHLIQISAQAISPKEATLLANTIAQEYTHQQSLRQQTAIKKEADQLQNKVRLKETTVSNLFAEASRLRTAAGYVDPNPDSSDTSLRPEESTTPASEEKVNEIQAKIANLKSRLDTLDHLKLDNLAQATALLNLNDPVLEQKFPLYQNALAEKARLLSSGLGHNHPEVLTIQGQIEGIEEQIRQEVSTIRTELSAQLATAQNDLITVETNLSANQGEQKRKEANAQYVEAKQRYDLAREALANAKALAAAKAKLNSEPTQSTKAPQPAVIIKLATTALRTGRFSVSFNLLVGAAAGLLLGLIAALLVGALDRSIKSPEEVEKRLGLPLLAVVPRYRWRRRLDSGDSNQEPYETLRTNVQMARQRVAASVLAVVSGGSQEGKSTTAAKLAMAYAGSEHQTLVIDVALRRPIQHRLFGIENGIGLSNYLRGEKTLEEIIQGSGTPNLFIVTSGPSAADAMKHFTLPKFAELVETAKDWFDVVILDCPSTLGPGGSTVICALAEGVIIVAQHRRNPCSMVIRTKDALQNLGTKVLGVVLNNAYMKPRTRNFAPSVAVHKRPQGELEAAEFQTALNRLQGNDPY
jgi:capsular exopolysaccharide synthesis family protein